MSALPALPATGPEHADASREGRRTKAPVRARELGLALLLGALALPGAWPGAGGEPDPLAATVWVALVALPAGHAAAVMGLRTWPVAPVVPILWVLTIALADAVSKRDLPAPAWGALAVVGLFGLGLGLGRWTAKHAWRGVALTALASVALSLPAAWGLVARRALPSRVAARALDVSPVTFAVECAGVDWMRHPPVYVGASTVDIDPSLRAPYEGRLAGVLVFVVGCAAASIRRRT